MLFVYYNRVFRQGRNSYGEGRRGIFEIKINSMVINYEFFVVLLKLKIL